MKIANARLLVQVQPAGATVYVDGLRSGTSPVSLDLPAGQYEVRIELDGYETLVRTVDLAAGAPAIVDGTLAPNATSPPSDQVPTPAPTSIPRSGNGKPLPDLAIKTVKIELETGDKCDYRSTQLGVALVVENRGDADAGDFVVDVNGLQKPIDAGLVSGGTASLWFEGYNRDGENRVMIDSMSEVEESDEGNNLLAQRLPIPTLPPPCTPTPTTPLSSLPAPTNRVGVTFTPLPPPPSASVSVYESQVEIASYPFADYLAEAWNKAFNMPYYVLDRPAYEGSNPSPVEVSYPSIVLENEYLKLTFLPDLGGRLYEVYFKPVGHRATYRNPVLKPSPWGPPEQGWWLAVGGLEWCLPVEEHGYEWGIPWTAEISQDPSGATITLSDSSADDRLRAKVAVGLDAGMGYFTLQPRLENPTNAPIAVKYWTNAMLAPGGQNAPSADLRFVLPRAATAVTVHSRGDESLPDRNEQLSWPVHDGRDLSRLGNWNRWLGFFQDPVTAGFMAVYDEGHDEGMVRVPPREPGLARGVKGFGFGWHDPIPPNNWTDDNSSYVEIHSGPAPTFDDSVTLPAGGSLEWTETWYPVAGLGRLNFANDIIALGLKASHGRAEIAVAANKPWQGNLILLLDDQERWRQAVSLAPDRTFRDSVAFGSDAPKSGQLLLRIEGPGGELVAEYAVDYGLSSG